MSQRRLARPVAGEPAPPGDLPITEPKAEPEGPGAQQPPGLPRGQNDTRRCRRLCDRRAVRLAWVEEGGGATCAELLATVPHWFGIIEANEEYRRAADRCPTLVANDNGQPVGFLTVVRHALHAAELHVMAVRPELHRNGIGRILVAVAEDRLRSEGVEYLQVKTLSASAADKPYLGTLAFYAALDFRVLEEMPSLWGPDNPAVLLIKRL